MKKIVPEYSFSEEQLHKIRSIASKCGIRELTAKILFSRGADTPEKAEKFLNPSKKHFLSPFLMRGMRELKESILSAKESGKKIVVYGDYDADGICATSIMVWALREVGADCYAYIPERAEGYGMNVSALNKIINEQAPGLFITVDCGISNREEVEYIRSRGVEVIVTDHHELPDILPDCVIVNPKLVDDYPYDNLCGAGVAFKTACALLGESAYKLADLAAIATVADSVPLTGENRDIVYEGLLLINHHPREAIKYLLAGKTDEITAQSLAFTVAPRVNAAGRMGEANCALRLFTSESASEIYSLACKLNEFNLERQQVCDAVYQSVKKRLEEGGVYENVIMLYDETWSTGLVGIVAAKISEEFNRPVILFVKNGDSLKGSARTIDNVNIYEALKACSEFIEEFGGHAQAAGVKVKESDFEKLKKALSEYLDKNYTEQDFIPAISVCEEADFKITPSLAKELERLEPCGVGNRKPLFSISAESEQVRRLKDGSPHIAIKKGEVDLLWFGGEKAIPLIESGVGKKFIFECGVSTFRGETNARGVIRDMVFDSDIRGDTRLYLFRNNLLRLQNKTFGVDVIMKGETEITAEIERLRNECRYGLVIISNEEVPSGLSSSVSGMERDVFYLSASNAGNVLLISPVSDVSLNYYREVIFLDTPADYNIPALAGKRVLVNKDRCGFKDILNLDTSRETLGEIYRLIRESKVAKNSVLLATGSETGYAAEQVIFAAEVFSELGLLKFINGKVSFVTGKKTDLNKSCLYNAVCELKNSFDMFN